MSDAPPPPKTKPGSLRDRIAAFETKPAAEPSAAPPPARPKPGNVSWKPRPASPAPAESSGGASPPPPPRKLGAFSAADAQESIGKAGSLKERMAALKAQGAFGASAPAPPPPKPASDKPRWKPPPVVSPPAEEPQEGTPSASAPETDASSAKSLEESGTENVLSDRSASAEESTPAPESGEPEGEPDAEEEERQRRAAIAARMARLGGARLGMAPPLVARKSERKPTSEEEHATAELQPPASEVPLSDKTTEDLQEKAAETGLAAPPRELPQRQQSSTSVLSVESTASNKASAPTSMPMPAAPRRAGPPRKKAFKSPSPAQSTEQPVVTSPDPIVEEPATPVEDVDVKDVTLPVDQAMTALPPAGESATDDPPATVSEPVEEAEEINVTPAEPAEEEREDVSTEVAGSIIEEEELESSEHVLNTVYEPERAAEHLTETGEMAPSHAEALEEAETTPESEQDSEQEPESAPASAPAVEEEEEEDVAARRQRIAARVAKMGGYNPFGAPAPPTPGRQQSVETPASPPPSIPASEEEASHPEAEETVEAYAHEELAATSEHDAYSGQEDFDDTDDQLEEDREDESQMEEDGETESAGVYDEEPVYDEEVHASRHQHQERVSLSEVVDAEIDLSAEAVESSGYEEDSEDKDEATLAEQVWTPPITEEPPKPPARRSLPPPPRTLPVLPPAEIPPAVFAAHEQPEAPVSNVDEDLEELEPEDEETTEAPQMEPEVSEEEAYEEDVEVGMTADSTHESALAEAQRQAPIMAEPSPQPPPRPGHRGGLPPIPSPTPSPSPPRPALPPLPGSQPGSPDPTSRRVSRGFLPPVPVPVPGGGLTRAGSISRTLPTPPGRPVGHVLPPIQTGSEDKEILDEDDGDPIDPQFHSPRSAKPNMQTFPPTPLPPAPISEAEEEIEPQQEDVSARKQTLAERMAKLGGIRFGAPLPAPSSASRPLPTVPEPNTDALAEPAAEVEEQEQEPMDEEAEELARRQRIAAKLAGMGAMRFGMVPPTMPARSVPAPAPEPPSSGGLQRALSKRGPLPRPPAPPPLATGEVDLESEGQLTEDDGVRVEAEDSEVEEVTHADVEEEAPPIPSRAERRSNSTSEAPPLPPGRPVRPPVPTAPAGGYGRRSSGDTAVQPPRRTSHDYPVRNNSDFVMIDDPEVDAPPPPPPTRPSRGGAVGHHPTRVLPPEPGAASKNAWELPSIPSGSFDFGQSVDLSSSTFSEDSTNYAAEPEPEPVRIPTPPPRANPTSPPPSAPLPPQPEQFQPRKQSVEVQLSADELTVVWGHVGVHIAEVAANLHEKSKKSLIGDGSFAGFVDAVLQHVPNAARPSSYGQLIYAQTGSSVQKRSSDIMPGDIVMVLEAKLKGHKGLKSYTQQVGFDTPAIGVVAEFEHKKSKIKVYQANQHVGQQTVESVSYRLEDLESGTVKVFRVLEA